MKKAILFSLLVFGAVASQAQSKIGGIPPANPGAVLELESTNKGFLPPRMTTAQRDAINSGTIATGMVIYNTDNNCLEFWSGIEWISLCTTTVSVNVAVDSLYCANITTTGDQPISGQPVSGYTVFLPYTGGNGAPYSGQIYGVAAGSAVQGITAILIGGNASGNGNLQFLISGTPSSSGQATFDISFGGHSCTFSIDVLSGAAVAAIANCGTSFAPSNTITRGTAVPANTTVTMSYTGGNGGSYNTIVASSTNVAGMTATLNGGPINNGTGNLVWTISGTPSNGPASTAAFSFIFAGLPCSFSVPAAAGGGTVTTLGCPGTQSGPVTAGISASGTTVRLINTGVTAGPYGAVGPIASFPAGLTASAPPGTMDNGTDTLFLNLAGTPPAAGVYTFNLTFGTQSCTVNVSVGANGVIAGNTTCAGKPISVTPCSTVPNVSINDDPTTTLGTEYNVGSNIRLLVEIGGQCWFRINHVTGTNATNNWPTTGSPVNTTFGTSAQWGTTAITDLGYHGFYNTTTTNGSAGWGATEPAVGEGRLYQWSAAMNGSTTERAQGVCPVDWHIPSDCEWMFLENSLGMSVAEQQLAGSRASGTVGTKLKSGGSSGFVALMAGFRDTGFIGRSGSVSWWSSTAPSAAGANYRYVVAGLDNYVNRSVDFTKRYAYSVRCLKN